MMFTAFGATVFLLPALVLIALMWHHRRDVRARLRVQ
jgi:hypothetical protein